MIRQNDGGGGEPGIYRPYFVGYLGKNESGQDKYLLVWGESPAEADAPKITYGFTTDFIHVQRDPRGHADWGPVSDGLISPWREGNKLYLFSGKHVHVMILPVSSRCRRLSQDMREDQAEGQERAEDEMDACGAALQRTGLAAQAVARHAGAERERQQRK